MQVCGDTKYGKPHQRLQSAGLSHKSVALKTHLNIWRLPMFVLLLPLCNCEAKSGLRLSVNLEEELPRNTVVADMEKLIADGFSQFPGQLEEGTRIAEMNVRFLEPNSLFYLHLSQLGSHLLRIKARVDREANCAESGICCQPATAYGASTQAVESNVLRSADGGGCTMVLLFLADLTLQTSTKLYSRQQLVQLEINLLDINDNAPNWKTFSSASINLQQLNKTQAILSKSLDSNLIIPRLDLSIPEHTSIGTRIALPSPVDPDSSPENTTASYGIESQTMADAFLLDWDRNSAGTSALESQASNLWLVVNRDLNHDDQSEHHVLIYASDAGRPKPLTGFLLLNISITDINDHPPKFLKRSDAVWVREHTTTGTNIYHPAVHDDDPSDKFRLTFGFRPSTLSVSQQRFTIDPRKGSVSIHGQLDYEQEHFHQLFIFVSDGKWTDEMKLDVYVINLNDHAPEIQLHSHLAFGLPDMLDYHANVPHAQLTIVVRENGPVDQLVATATVTDKDSVAEVRARNFFSSVEQKEVRFTEPNDQSRLIPPVNVLQPVCSLSNPQFRIEPLVVDGLKQSEEKFRFKITLAGQALDREKQPRLVLKIVCHDQFGRLDRKLPVQTTSELRSFIQQQTTQSHSATAILRILVSDENDSPPNFLGPMTAELSEDAPIDTLVARLKATDDDDPHTNAGNAGLRFQLLQPARYLISEKVATNGEDKDLKEPNQSNNHGLPAQPWFYLNSVTGDLKSLVQFDREKVRTVVLTVEIRDGGDLDQSLLHTNKSGGGIHKQLAVNRINVTITIDIKDANDCTPKFSQQLYEFNVSEDAVPPIHIGKLRVRDCDVDEANHAVTYWLQMNAQSISVTQPSQDGKYKQLHTDAHIHTWFSVSRTGDLFLRTPQTPVHPSGMVNSGAFTPLDRERNELIVMDVFARDAGSPSLTGSAQLLIRVLDVNDHAPEWEFPKPQNRIVNLSIDTAIGNRVAQLVALDPDEGPRGLVLYSILSGNEGGQFELDSNSGWIYLARSLHRNGVPASPHLSGQVQNTENLNRYSNRWPTTPPTMLRLYVQASDSGTPPRTSSSVLDIIIQQTQTSRYRTLSIQPQAHEQTGKLEILGGEQTLQSRTLFDADQQPKWQRDHDQYTQRGWLVPSDFLTLIAMVTATLAALVLVFILFIVIRCRRLRVTDHVPPVHRNRPREAHKHNWSLSTQPTARGTPSRRTEINGQQSLKPKCSYAFWSRFGLTHHPTLEGKEETPPHERTDLRTTTTHTPIPILLPTTQETFGSTGSLAEFPDAFGSEREPHGNTLVYSIRSSDHTTIQSQRLNPSVNSGGYNLVVHGSHPLDDKLNESKYARIFLNNSHDGSKYLCNLPAASDMQLLHPTAYGVCEIKDPSRQTSLESSIEDKTVTIPNTENPLGAESKRCRTANDYTPLGHKLSISKSEVNSMCQPSSFV